MSEHDPKSEDRVEDLDVPESETEEVKGGLNFSKIEQKFSKIDVASKANPGNLRSFGDGSV
jgi:hypothetical protein